MRHLCRIPIPLSDGLDLVQAVSDADIIRRGRHGEEDLIHVFGGMLESIEFSPKSE